MAESAARHYSVKGVTFIPNYMNPLKGAAISTEHRLAMLRLFVKEPHDIYEGELEKEGLSYTVDTLEALSQEDSRRLIWLMGADCLVHFHLWKNVPRLMELAQVQLITRPGFPLKAPDELIELVGDEKVCQLLDQALVVEIPYSSTQIRHQILTGQRPEGLSEAVWEYIRENDLYT